MTLEEYQQAARQTAIYTEPVIYPVLGLCSEAGELAGKIKKVIRDNGGEITAKQRLDILKELGDVLWYVAAIASDFDCQLSTVAEWNIDKLNDRAMRDKIQGNGDER